MRKLKQCSFCEKDTYLWKSNPAACKPCWQREQAKTPKQNKSPVRSSIKPVSDKKAKELKEYRKLRDQYLKDHPLCEVCGTPNNLTLHHKRPRAFFLCDVSIFMTCCVRCHDRIHSEDQWARDNGYLLSKHKI